MGYKLLAAVVGAASLVLAGCVTSETKPIVKIPAKQVLIASTGVIGVPLPMDKIRAALPKLVKSLSPNGGHLAAESIMTTDTRPKEAALRVEINGRPALSAHPIDGTGAMLRNQVGKQVLLKLKNAEGERRVVVTPISAGADADLRYHEWQYTRRLRVEELGGGDIGYVHLRAMGGRPRRHGEAARPGADDADVGSECLGHR